MSLKRREFLQLAHVFEPNKSGDFPWVAGWLLSEKLDGQRAWWDGGASRGLAARDVPWANVEKDARLLDTQYRATGLWTRYGRVIRASEEWLDQMPLGMSLDGELYLGRGQHQAMREIVAAFDSSDSEWREVQFAAFASPPVTAVLQDGEVKDPHFRKVIRYNECLAAVPSLKKVRHFEESALLRAEGSDNWYALRQTKLVSGHRESLAAIKREMEEVLQENPPGEGLMLRCPNMAWTPERVHHLLKVKPDHDSEARVVGYTWGRVTDKGSRLLGKMGALSLRWTNSRGATVYFNISGFTDEQREMVVVGNEDFVAGQGRPTSGSYAKHFPIGTEITFLYREETNDGIPKEARFSRIR